MSTRMGGHKACGVIVRRSRRGAAYGIEQHPRSGWGAIARRDDLGIGAARIDLGGVEFHPELVCMESARHDLHAKSMLAVLSLGGQLPKP